MDQLPDFDKRKGVCKRKVKCPDCGYVRAAYAAEHEVRCRACADKLRRTGGEVECPGCGKSRYLAHSEIEKGIRYCSIQCANANVERASVSEKTREKARKAKLGRQNPNFKHGKRSADAGAVSNRRWGIREKGESLCRNCGAEAHHLHHIVPRSQTKRGLHDVERNGLPLCAACHFGWHRRSLTIYRDVLSPVELAFAMGAAGEGWVDLWYPNREEVADAGSIENARVHLTPRAMRAAA